MYMKTYSESSQAQPICFVREASIEDETSDQDTSFYLIYPSGTVHVKVSNYLETPKQITIFVDPIPSNTQLLVADYLRKSCKELSMEEWLGQVFGNTNRVSLELSPGDSIENIAQALDAALEKN